MTFFCIFDLFADRRVGLEAGRSRLGVDNTEATNGAIVALICFEYG